MIENQYAPLSNPKSEPLTDDNFGPIGKNKKEKEHVKRLLPDVFV